MNQNVSEVHSEVARLRMLVATDSAMLLAVLRQLSPQQLGHASKDFLQACEGLNVSTLYSELDEATLQQAQSRRDWWIGLIAELVAEDAGLSVDETPTLPDAA